MLRAITTGALIAACSVRARAHTPAPDGPEMLRAQWDLDPLVWLPLLIASGLYLRGSRAYRGRLGRRPAALRALAPALFVLGQAAVAFALLSPLDTASGTLLSAHMLQHVLLVAVAPPLLLAGRADVVCFRGLPAAWRRLCARNLTIRAALQIVRALAHVLPATVLHGAALWIWHAPGLFEAARSSTLLHALEHACFFGTALLFWRGMLASSRRPAAALAGAFASLVTLVHGGLLGALIGLSPSLLYPLSTRGAELWGVTPLEDQQLAGAIMWVPAGAIYLLAGLGLMARAIAPRRTREQGTTPQVAEAKGFPVSTS